MRKNAKFFCVNGLSYQKGTGNYSLNLIVKFFSISWTEVRKLAPGSEIRPEIQKDRPQRTLEDSKAKIISRNITLIDLQKLKKYFTRQLKPSLATQPLPHQTFPSHHSTSSPIHSRRIHVRLERELYFQLIWALHRNSPLVGAFFEVQDLFLLATKTENYSL